LRTALGERGVTAEADASHDRGLPHFQNRTVLHIGEERAGSIRLMGTSFTFF